MTQPPIRLVVFDMAGTTVCDRDEVLFCFTEACLREGLPAERSRLNALMGVSKLEVFQMLWREVLGVEAEAADVRERADRAFLTFRDILENYYLTHPVEPTDGALEVFGWLRQHDIKIALNTGFYRTVTDIILNRLGWLAGLDRHYVGGAGSVINLSMASDEVPLGRPEPFMILKAMAVFGIEDPKQVLKIGDTPVDIEEGKRAGCAASLVVTNGTHSRAELEPLGPDGLLASLRELPEWMAQRFDLK